MRRLLILFLLIGLGADAQQDKKSVATPPLIHPDTTFLLRTASKDFYHAVFIERNRQSVYYQQLTDFNFDKYDLEAFNQNYQQLKEKKQLPLKKQKLAGLPSHWMPLYLYKGKYYVYIPSDYGNLGRRIITDTALVYWWMDGPEIRPLQKAVKINKGEFSFLATSNYANRTSKLNVYIIDPKLNIAVFEDASLPPEYKYRLYVPKESIKNFDVVVNYCRTEKVPEFEFEKVNFKKLLAGRK